MNNKTLKLLCLIHLISGSLLILISVFITNKITVSLIYGIGVGLLFPFFPYLVEFEKQRIDD